MELGLGLRNLLIYFTCKLTSFAIGSPLQYPMLAPRWFILKSICTAVFFRPVRRRLLLLLLLLLDISADRPCSPSVWRPPARRPPPPGFRQVAQLARRHPPPSGRHPLRRAQRCARVACREEWYAVCVRVVCTSYVPHHAFLAFDSVPPSSSRCCFWTGLVALGDFIAVACCTAAVRSTSVWDHVGVVLRGGCVENSRIARGFDWKVLFFGHVPRACLSCPL